jgi:phenylacetate-coenzyme A ligase PaaK-like adenylate-forming protein
MAAVIRRQQLTCTVGLPQHLLALAVQVGPGYLKSMLLCSDYAPTVLREHIEAACGCETFLHYGATESGLGCAVECRMHRGCHIRESDLLLEIIDPQTCRVLPDSEVGVLVITTLNRRAMPLVRYRTGDRASLDRAPCPCGGVTARLCNIRGRLNPCILAGGGHLFSQDLDDWLYRISGLLDYRLTLERGEREQLHVDFIATPGKTTSAPRSAGCSCRFRQSAIIWSREIQSWG